MKPLPTPIDRKQAEELIRSTSGRIFGVSFITKDKRLRHMSARLGVRKGVQGVLSLGDREAEDKKFGYITAYDFNADWKANDKKGAFRRINFNTLLRIQINGIDYKIIR